MKRLFVLVGSAMAVAAAIAVGSLLGQPATAQELAGFHMTVHKSPTCGCCADWIDIVRSHGMEITIVDTDDVVAIKRESSVPAGHYSCHTAEVDGYVAEGHVPVEALIRLLTERPEIDGIALGGMPAGSPGMNGVKTAPLEVVAFDGTEVTLFGLY